MITSRMEQPVRSKWCDPPTEWSSEEATILGNKFRSFESCVEAVNLAVEDARGKKDLRANLEADIMLVVPEGSASEKFLKDIGMLAVLHGRYLRIARLTKPAEPELSAILLCSKVHILNSSPTETETWSYSRPFKLLEEGKAIVIPAKGRKCPRCWMYTSISEQEPCERCAGVVERFAAQL